MLFTPMLGVTRIPPTVMKLAQIIKRQSRGIIEANCKCSRFGTARLPSLGIAASYDIEVCIAVGPNRCVEVGNLAAADNRVRNVEVSRRTEREGSCAIDRTQSYSPTVNEAPVRKILVVLLLPLNSPIVPCGNTVFVLVVIVPVAGTATLSRRSLPVH